jgi:hypothetical protein
MSHSEAPISITVKTAAGSLVTVRASHGEELDQVLVNGLDAIVSATQELEAGIRGVSAPGIKAPAVDVQAAFGSTITNVNYDDAPTMAAPTAVQSAPALGGQRTCPHGRMTPIQGMGKDGKPYKGYFCPAPKGAFDKCKNHYIKVTDLEWNTFVPEQIK